MLKHKVTRRDFVKISAMTAAVATFDIDGLKASSMNDVDKQKYPVIVIGAGLGGLTCAAYLAKVGFPVTVFEKHNVPGGYATSFQRGDFEFEVSLHAIAANNNATYTIIKELGLLDKVELVKLKNSHRLINGEKDLLIPDTNPEAYMDLLSGYYPSEKEGIRGFVNEIIGINEEVYTLFQNKNEYVTLFFPFQYSKMWNVRNKTLKDLLDNYIHNVELKDTLSFLCGYYGLPPSRLSGFYYANSVADYLKNGSFYVKNRSQGLSNALAEIIQENKGSVLVDTPVKKILVNNNVVTGVETEDSKLIPAKIVVSNASTPDTFGKLLSSKSQYTDYTEKISNFRPSISSCCIWMGLNTELRGKIKGCNIHVKGEGSTEESFGHALRCDAEKAGFVVTIFDNYFQDYSVPGKSTVMITCLSGYEPWKIFENKYFTGNKKEYYQMKEKVTQTLIKRTEKRVIPGLSSMIEELDSSTPLTNIYYTRNPEGAIYGYEQSMNNHFMERIKNSTPIEGLYLAGAWGYPGGGFTGVMRSGLRTSRLIVENF
jgi:prolycopene isomerase